MIPRPVSFPLISHVSWVEERLQKARNKLKIILCNLPPSCPFVFPSLFEPLRRRPTVNVHDSREDAQDLETKEKTPCIRLLPDIFSLCCLYFQNEQVSICPNWRKKCNLGVEDECEERMRGRESALSLEICLLDDVNCEDGDETMNRDSNKSRACQSNNRSGGNFTRRSPNEAWRGPAKRAWISAPRSTRRQKHIWAEGAEAVQKK